MPELYGYARHLASGKYTKKVRVGRIAAVYLFFAVLGIVASLGVFFWNNPADVGSPEWSAIAGMRGEDLIVIAVVATCQAFATVTFQTATQNRILTPSIMGFESLYRLIQTGIVFMLGAAGGQVASSTGAFLLQAAVMVAFSVVLYAWLLGGRSTDLHGMLLIGIVIGGGLGSLTTFMQRVMDPADFDVLTARLFGNISNADTGNLRLVIPIVVVTCGIILARSERLNVMALGREIGTNLGLNYRRELISTLILVSILMAMTTSLVGPMTFLGFLVAMLAYTLADTFEHRHLLPIAALAGYAVLATSYFVLRHVFYAGGVVTVIVELLGGITFLIVVLRKGRL